MMIKEETRDISGEERGLPRRTSRRVGTSDEEENEARAAEMKGREAK